MLLYLLACVPTDPKDVDTGEATDTDTSVTDTSDTDTSDTDTSDTDTSDTSETLHEACELDHVWLTDAPRVIEATYVGDWSFQAWQLDVWLFTNGLGWLTPTAYSVSTWRIRYTTQDRGVPVEATAIVSVPVLSGEAEVGTVLWHHPTAGFEDACAPSVGAVEGLAPAIISAARGYVSVAPDYLGLMGGGDPAPDPHPWIVGEPTAIASLDALRAVDAWLPLSALDARVDTERIVYWGWSEGGFAALQSDRYAPSYAPEYAPVGVIAAVPPVDILGQLEAGLETLSPATRADALILYLHAEWYGYDALDQALATDVAAALPGEAAASCTSFPSVESATSVDAIYDPAFLAAVRAGERADPWTCFLEQSSLPNPNVPYTGDAPVLIITAESDTLVPAAPVRAAIPALCDEGYTLQHIECAGLEHGEAPLMTLMDQVGWLDARMRGDAVDPGCGVQAPVTCDG
ncbi:MAG: lipase family protein [Myxococcota bacterium]